MGGFVGIVVRGTSWFGRHTAFCFSVCCKAGACHLSPVPFKNLTLGFESRHIKGYRTGTQRDVQVSWASIQSPGLQDMHVNQSFSRSSCKTIQRDPHNRVCNLHIYVYIYIYIYAYKPGGPRLPPGSTNHVL